MLQTMSVSGGLRELKKQRTHDDIQRVATRLFLERGFDNVTVDDIGAEAEVSHRTFYRYFACKEDLVLGNVGEMLDSLRSAFIRRAATESVIESIRVVILELAASYEQDVENDRLRAQLVMSSASLRDRRHEHLVAFEAGLVPLVARRLSIDANTDMRPALIAACAAAAVRVAMDSWMADDGHGALAPRVQQAFAILTTGLN